MSYATGTLSPIHIWECQGTPAPEAGSESDYAIDATTGIMYRKTNGVWSTAQGFNVNPATIPGYGDLLSTNNLDDVASPSASLTNLGGLAAANNLSDVASPSAARTSLGLGTIATMAASAFAAVANNLSDLASAATARINLGLGTIATMAASAFLQASNNLSDLASAATARTNLGLGTIATAAASAYAAVANNLSDLASAATARTNLGLGTIATAAASAYAAVANNLSDLANVATARTNLGVVKTNSASSDPGVGNDNTQGYAAGSEWTNTTTGRTWTALSVATGAAVWQKQTGVMVATTGTGAKGATTLVASATGVYRASAGCAGGGTVNVTVQIAWTDAFGHSNLWSFTSGFNGTGQYNAEDVLIAPQAGTAVQYAVVINSGTAANAAWVVALEPL